MSEINSKQDNNSLQNEKELKKHILCLKAKSKQNVTNKTNNNIISYTLNNITTQNHRFVLNIKVDCHTTLNKQNVLFLFPEILSTKAVAKENVKVCNRQL